ncbi:MAG: aminotransferase class V-fold PLP-dependent enzyme [Pseudobutyrivibrio sp.]|nr:aminotransferase class V-fold PLP-dependent enzyme [Pseudobutyrivibrio sp.]
MLYFACDYAEGCHPKLLEALSKTNMVSVPGYGEDDFCGSAKEKIKKVCNCPDADIYFLVGGTQANQTVIDSVLEKCEGVVAATTGHVAIHEAGAIEFSGNKVITLPSYDGKLKASDLKTYMVDFYNDPSHEHMVIPGMVYISYPTEYGTLYSKTELTEISEICKEYDLALYIDGARLGYGLVSPACDITMEELASLCDVFYIGGTKVGALFGEAVVFTHGNAPKHFVNLIKKHGALLAKGRVLGVQFDALFTDDLYLSISRNAIEMAQVIKDELASKGYEFFINSPTNQIFVVMENEKLKVLSESVVYSFWEKYDDTKSVIRIATSWATERASVSELLKFF